MTERWDARKYGMFCVSEYSDGLVPDDWRERNAWLCEQRNRIWRRWRQKSYSERVADENQRPTGKPLQDADR